MGFWSSCSRVLLVIFNFIFWLSGAAILGVGIWFLVDPEIQARLGVIQSGSADDSFRIAAYIFIAFGGVVFLVGFSGCCGAIRNSRCLLGFYMFCLVLIFCAELGAGIYVAVKRNEIESELDATLVESIKQKYDDAKESSVGRDWDVTQIQLECCGGLGPMDYENSKWSNKTKETIPVSCCVLNSIDVDNPKPKDKDLCQRKTDTYFHAKGCKEALMDWMKQHGIILIGVGLGIAFVQVFGLVFSIILCRHLEGDHKY